MENLYIKKDNNFIKIKSIECIDDVDCLIFKMDRFMPKQSMFELQCGLEAKLKKKCIVIDPSVKEIYGVKNG